MTPTSERRLLNEFTLEAECFLVMRRIISGERLVRIFDTLYVEGTRFEEMYDDGEEIEAGLQGLVSWEGASL